MEFNRLLEYFDSEAGQKEQVALIIYFLEEYDGQSEATPSTVKDVIQRSRSTVKTSSVSKYFSRLEDARWITSAENGGYRLTHPGEDGVTTLLDDDVLDNPREDHFIRSDEIVGNHYEKLVSDINESYKHRIYDATMVLTRKLFEDLTFQILRTHYAGDDVQMFYDQENERHYSFDELLDNLRDGVPTLRRYSRELERGVVDEVRELKEEGNTGAHSIKVDFTDEEVEEWADDVTRMAEILYDVLMGARIADEQGD